MGQSKVAGDREVDVFLDIYKLLPDDTQEAMTVVLFPMQRHLKGQGRFRQVKGRAGAIVALLLNPHDPVVVEDLKGICSIEAQEEFIPQIQEIGRSLLRVDWFARVELEELGLFNYESLVFYSSEDVAERLGMNEHVSVVEPSTLIQLAVQGGRTIA